MQNRINTNKGNPLSQRNDYQPRVPKQYSPFDSRKLGFHGYQQYRNRNSNLSQSRANQYDNYVYNPNDYPSLQNQQTCYSNLMSNEGHVSNSRNENQGFLELVKTIREMREAQSFFHQELLSLKTQFAHPFRAPNLATQGYLSQQPQQQFQNPSAQVENI